MSMPELIKKGQIADKKQEIVRHIIAGRAALGALLTDGAYAQDKKIEDVDTAVLTAHLTSLIEHQERIKELQEEIARLEY